MEHEPIARLEDIRVWQYEVTLEDVGQKDDYTRYSIQVAPTAHYIGRKHDVITAQLISQDQAYTDLITRINAALTVSFTKTYYHEAKPS
ncbi:hypothetical protein [Vibrio mexicanus]|uniref:hypothetical protein n=1 Tax=Vibrio mexicanus TaxID=1004326 RepID=UPI00063C9D17|nr:hypothetical protein [Vibrio mexicanus]